MQPHLLEPYGVPMTPSVGLYVGGKARERGVDFKDTKLKVGLFGAEPWPWATTTTKPSAAP